MAYRIRYAPEFNAEFEDTLVYIRNKLQNPIAADNLVSAFDETVSSIVVFPRSTLPFTVGGVDYYHVRVKNYLAFYVVREDTVEFRRFLYARSDVLAKLS